MLIRKLLEEQERRTLSPYATLSSQTRGRRVPEEPCPIRTEFQRDRDRIIHGSKAFRRLSYKTQVFISPAEDHYRTRLSHTLEVAQIARTIARALRLNEELTEAIALGHDLGHPPFGHAGEEGLDEVYRSYDPQARFRHWEQSLRVVDVLEKDGCGLNLTWEVRNGILTHAKGRFDVQSSLDTDTPATLEGCVVKVADRIAYLNHDIDDAIRARILTLDDLPQEALKVLGRRHGERVNTMVASVITSSLDQPFISLGEEIAAAMDCIKEFLFENVYLARGGPNADRDRIKRLIHSLFHLYMERPKLVPHFQKHGAPEDVPTRARFVCDYLAGMTDRYAKQQYIAHFLPRDWRTL